MLVKDPKMTEILAIAEVSKRYGSTTVLSGVSKNFQARKITALIGPSGCGKSTLLKLCNGLLRPDKGEVHVMGQPIDYESLPQLRRSLGYAVQGTGLFPHLTARENITLMANVEGWEAPRIEKRLRELIALNQLDEAYLPRYPHELSGGQQQRVGLCRTMMLSPEVMLLDEPFAAIDPITRNEIQQQFLTAHKAEPVTVLLVTHDIREALFLADHIVVMHEGKISHSVDKADLYSNDAGRDAEKQLQSLIAGTVEP